ncbi:MAG: UTP--glucose-1-phosphate uridylyltransferase, partial [Anaerolineae bacterium]
MTPATRQRLQESQVLVHGGLAQNVGPILEMVTEKYLLRSEAEWAGRKEACAILDQVVAALCAGDIRRIGAVTTRNFVGPIQTIIPWAGNLYTERLIQQARAAFGDRFWGFWMLGGMSGGGMGFIFDPAIKPQAQERMLEIMRTTKRRLETAMPFAMEPVVYDFAINERGTWAEWVEIMPAGYYVMIVPELLRRDRWQLPAARRADLDLFGAACRTRPEMAGMIPALFDRLLPRGRAEQAADRSLEAI